MTPRIKPLAILLAGCMAIALSPFGKAEAKIADLYCDKPWISVDTEAAAMALIEAETGALLASQNCNEPLPMASTTKIMTALVVLENCELDEMVEVDERAEGVEGSSMYLQKGERISVRDLLYGLMLASGNDAAVALACHVSGSEIEFAELMNARAAELGLENTHFVTVNGLTAEGHHTTAYELCLLAREAMRNETFLEIVSIKYYKTETGSSPRTLKNKNSLLWDYEGALGVKTGYTMAAGRCLVFAAERDGMTLIGCLLNCRPMFEKAAELMDAAFNTYCLHTVIEQGKTLFEAEVKNGVQKVLAVDAKNSIIAVVRKNGTAEFSASATVYELTAPIARGDIVGEVTVYLDGTPVGASPLVASCYIARSDLAFWFSLAARLFAA